MISFLALLPLHFEALHALFQINAMHRVYTMSGCCSAEYKMATEDMWAHRARRLTEIIQSQFKINPDSGRLYSTAIQSNNFGLSVWTIGLMFVPSEPIATLPEDMLPIIEAGKFNVKLPSAQQKRFTDWKTTNKPKRRVEPGRSKIRRRCWPAVPQFVILKFVDKDGLRAAVLDSFFYYTNKEVARAFKEAFKPHRVDELIEVVKRVAFSPRVNCVAMTLLDGYSGYNAGKQSFFSSADVKTAADALQAKAALTPGKKYLTKRFFSTEFDCRSHETRLGSAAKHGYYGLFGFVQKNFLTRIAKQVDETKVIQQAFRLARMNRRFPDERLLVCFKPVKVVLSFTDDGLSRKKPGTVWLECSPNKVFQNFLRPGSQILVGTKDIKSRRHILRSVVRPVLPQLA